MKVYRGAFLLLIAVSLMGCGQASPNTEEADLSSELSSPQAESAGDEAIIPLENQTLAEEFNADQATIDALTEELTDASGVNPARIEIPSLQIETRVMEVGLLEDGSMGVPENGEDVGWYEPGTMPGATGNSVLAGHVDDRTGPAIFFTLDQIEIGDNVFVTNEEGEEREFEVERIESYPYDDAPLEEVFGETSEQRLNLITCTGTFNRDQGTHEERLVVYTKLVSSEVEKMKPDAPSQIEIRGDLLSWHAVRDDMVIGYRIYETDIEGNKQHVRSISNNERKTFLIEDQDNDYVIRTVDMFGQESGNGSVEPR